jgi:CRP-like cAMP-binding protein
MEGILFKSALLRIESGSVVITPGQQNRRLYILIRSDMSIHLTDVDSEPVATLGRGDISGEFSIIDAQPASTYVIARSPCHLLGVDKDCWWLMFNRAPETAVNLMYILAKRLRMTNEQFQGFGRAGSRGFPGATTQQYHLEASRLSSS